MQTICFVQARLSSKRLPGKILLPIAGKPMLQHVVDRASRIPGVDKAVIVTAFQDRRTLEAALPAWQVLSYPIPEDDVLTRYVWAAVDCDADVVLRVTGDCPCLNPIVAGRVLQACIERNCYSTNDTSVSGFPDGWDAQAWPIAALLHESVQATDLRDREHPGRWADRQPHRVLVCNPHIPGPEHPKLSVDTQADLDRVRDILMREGH